MARRALGFALLLRFCGRYGRFPRGRADLRPEVIEFVARQITASNAHLNTLMIQGVLADGLVELSAEDQRGLTPLFWSNIARYGEVKLNMDRRLTLRADTATSVVAETDERIGAPTHDARPRGDPHRRLPVPPHRPVRRRLGRHRQGLRGAGLA